jgi:streptomycin 6-kinase
VFTEKQKNDIIENWGQNIFSKVLNELEFYSDKWKLSDLEFCEHYSVNLIFFCKSEIYGDCVLKIGADMQFAEEYNVLREYNGGRYVKIYESDINLAESKKAMLLERAVPGIVLREEQSLEKRLAVYSELISGLHIAPANPEIYISYIKFVNKYFDECVRENAGKENIRILTGHINRANDLYFELINDYNKKMLLHIDIYDGNIVSSSDGKYKIIDPKGNIGDPIFEMGQILFNECFSCRDQEQPENINFIFDYFEKSLNIPDKILRQVFYIETVRFICECNGGFDEDWEIQDLKFAEKIMNGEI